MSTNLNTEIKKLINPTLIIDDGKCLKISIKNKIQNKEYTICKDDNESLYIRIKNNFKFSLK